MNALALSGLIFQIHQPESNLSLADILQLIGTGVAIVAASYIGFKQMKISNKQMILNSLQTEINGWYYELSRRERKTVGVNVSDASYAVLIESVDEAITELQKSHDKYDLEVNKPLIKY